MSIEKHEIELKELLARVMRDPLQPLQIQLDQTGASLTEMDQQLKALRDVELSGVCARLEVIEQNLKRLRVWSQEDAASEFKNAILPPVQRALDTLGNRIDSHVAAFTLPVQSISDDVAHTTSAMERLAEHSAQGNALAIQRDASLGEQVRDLATHQAEQWRLTQAHVNDSVAAAVEKMSSMAASTNAAQVANLKRLVDQEVSKRIDKLIIQGRWAVGLTVTALLAASAGLFFLSIPHM